MSSRDCGSAASKSNASATPALGFIPPAAETVNDATARAESGIGLRPLRGAPSWSPQKMMRKEPTCVGFWLPQCFNVQRTPLIDHRHCGLAGSTKSSAAPASKGNAASVCDAGDAPEASSPPLVARLSKTTADCCASACSPPMAMARRITTDDTDTAHLPCTFILHPQTKALCRHTADPSAMPLRALARAPAMHELLYLGVVEIDRRDPADTRMQVLACDCTKSSATSA